MRKIAFFLIILGIFLLVLYLLSDIAGSPAIGLLLVGGLLFGLGIWIRTTARPPEKPESTRFRTIREWKKQRELATEKRRSEKNKPKSQR